MAQDDILTNLIRYVTNSLNEAHAVPDDFNIGQTYAYASVLEAIQSKCTPEELIKYGLDWSIEALYPIE